MLSEIPFELHSALISSKQFVSQVCSGDQEPGPVPTEVNGRTSSDCSDVGSGPKSTVQQGSDRFTMQYFNSIKLY